MTPQDWPCDAPTVQRWLRTMLSRGDGFVMEGADRIRIAVDLDGDDIESLDIDATGADLRPSLTDSAALTDNVALTDNASPGGTTAADAPAPPAPPIAPTVVDRGGGVLRHARLVAHPVRVHRVPIRVDAAVDRLPIEWLVHERPVDARRPETAFALSSAGDARGTIGSFAASMRTDDIGRLLLALIRPATAGSGVSVRRLRISLAPAGTEPAGTEPAAPERFRLGARATARWKLLRATVRIEARIRVAPSAVVTVEQFRIRSRNPLVAVLLRIARRDIRGYEGKRYDLNEDPAMPRVHDLRLSAGKDVSISARLG
jgi:hypothetical protein